MSLSSRISQFARNFSRTQPKSLITSGPNLQEFAMADQKNDRVPMVDLEKWYTKSPLVFSSINIFSDMCFGRGGYVKSNNPEAEKLCERAVMLPAFKPTAIGAIAHTLLYGQGFQEILWSDDNTGTEIEGYVLMDPKSIEPKWDDHATILRFEQSIEGSIDQEEKPKWLIYKELEDGKPGDKNTNPAMIYYRFFRIADNMRGIGFVEPIVRKLDTHEDILLSIKEMFHKFAYPMVHIKNRNALTKTELENMKEMFKDFWRKSFHATGDNINFELLGAAGKIPQLKGERDSILDEIVAGLRIPKPFLLGKSESAGLGQGDIRTLMEQNIMEISMLQPKLSQIFEEQIFKPLCNRNGIYTDIPKWVWNPIRLKDEAVEIDTTIKMIRQISDAKIAGLMTDEQGQKMFDDYMENKKESL